MSKKFFVIFVGTFFLFAFPGQATIDHISKRETVDQLDSFEESQFIAVLNHNLTSDQCDVTPYISYRFLDPFCTAIFVTKNILITSATCVEDVNEKNLVVLSGGNYITDLEHCHNVIKIVKFPGYQFSSPHNGDNLAFITLDSRAKHQNYSIKFEEAPDNWYHNCQIFGFGGTKTEKASQKLKIVDVDVFPEYSHKDARYPEMLSVHSKNEEGPCTIDSGGPLICNVQGDENKYLVGIAADHQTFETPACKYPALYTNLQYKYSEIDAKLKALSEKITADEISKTSKTIIKTKELQRSSEDKQANDSCNFTIYQCSCPNEN